MSYSKLEGKIVETFKTRGAFSIAMKMDAATLSGKLNGKTEWKRGEIEKACILLNIPVEKMHEYFF